MITCRYILDDVEKSNVKFYPNETIDVTYEELNVGKPPLNYISLDGLGIDLLDDTSHFAGDYFDDVSPYYCGYISQNVSDENGNSTDMIGVFGWRDGAFPQDNLIINHGITINFFKDFATEIEIFAFDAEDYKVYSNKFVVDKKENFFDLPEIVCNRMYIYFRKTNTPNSFIKIETLALGKIHNINSFFDFDLQDEKILLGSDLPIGQIEFSTTSKENLIGRQGNSLVFFEDSDLLGLYYLQEVERTSKETYKFTVQNLLYKLNKIIYNEYAIIDNQWKFKNVNAYDELEKLFEYCGVNYSIHHDFKNVWLTPYIETGKTARYVLQQICFAIGADIDCWRKDYIEIKPKTYTSTKTLSNSDNIVLNTKINSSSQKYGARWSPKILSNTDEEFLTSISATPILQDIRRDFDKIVDVNTYEIGQGNYYVSELRPNYIVVQVSGSSLRVKGNVLSETQYDKDINILPNKEFLKISNNNVVAFNNEAGDISNNETIKTLEIIDDYTNRFNGSVLTATIVYNGEKTGDKITIQANDDLYYTGVISLVSFNSSNNYRTAKIEVQLWSS